MAAEMSGRGRDGFASALSLLTIVGRGAGAGPEAVGWFPVVGAALGGGLGVAWWAFGRVLPPLVAAGLVVAGDLVLTGMLHADGLIDAADGLLPHLERAQRLEIMAEPQVGAFGVTAAFGVFVVRFGALASIPHASVLADVLLIAAIWVASRSLMALSMIRLSYVRDTGMAAAFGASGSWAHPVVPVAGLVAALAALLVWRPIAGGAVLAAEIAAFGAVLLVSERRLGGYTGDVLGAAGVVGETIALVLASAKW